jgi:hypothetical protein
MLAELHRLRGMLDKKKETSRGGLAVSVIEC